MAGDEATAGAPARRRAAQLLVSLVALHHNNFTTHK